MTVTVDGFNFEQPMTKVNGYYEFVASSMTDLRGRRVAVGSDHGGQYNDLVR